MSGRYVMTKYEGHLEKMVKWSMGTSMELCKLSRFQKILLAADGTLTNLLEIFMGEPIAISKLSEKTISVTEDILPLDIKVGTEIIKRQILLKGKTSQCAYLYAESIIVPNRIEEKFIEELTKSHTPIGELWVKYKTEAFKEIVTYAWEKAGDLCNCFGIREEDKLLSRTYRVLINRKPSIIITEKFPDNYFLSL